MNCSKCGEETFVADSRPNEFGIRRRRKCRSCGFKFSTVEMIVDAIPTFEIEKLVKNFHADILFLIQNNNDIEKFTNTEHAKQLS